ncbi:MAG: DUF1559 domain-containing protein [Gemmataceae bacterium]|nr:DUF1559 domain-containing protein [Gemmataceae bacterium]
MTHSASARQGFARIDLLVVVGLGVCLVGLLVPALRAARQQDARETTVKNLKAVALAMHAHADQHRRLPPAHGKVFGFKGNATAHVYLLPFVEELKLYRQYLQQGGGGVRDQAVVKAYTAPQDRSNPDPPAGIQNFAANLRVFGDTKTALNAAVPLADTMDSFARMPATFRDGTSNTVVFATKYGVCGKGGSRYASPVKADTAAFFGQEPATAAAAPSNPKATFQNQPSQKQCLCAPLTAQSYEERGLLIALADGSTRTVSPRLTAETWNRVLHPSDGEVPGKDWDE